MSFTSPTDGWVGSITRRQRLWKTEDGKTWTDMTASLPPLPSAICGISSPSKGVVFASGTQYPNREAAIMHTADGGQTWNSISMAAHANLLIDTYFVDDLHGWVVGGNGGTTYPSLKPVIMFTADGGKTWENKLQNSGIDFPTGEWGWKIQFLTPQIGFVSLENDTAAAILKTTDGGQSWKRIPITDPQRNVELEGVGFINEQVGWVGGWGHGFMAGTPDGTTSGTTDGGATWFDANGVGRFINRFRFTKTEPIVAYASGGTIYQCTVAEGAALAALAAAPRVVEPPIPKVWETLDITSPGPAKREAADDHGLRSAADTGEGVDRRDIAAAGRANLLLEFQDRRRRRCRHRSFHVPHFHRRPGDDGHGGPSRTRGSRRSWRAGRGVDQASRPARQTRA